MTCADLILNLLGYDIELIPTIVISFIIVAVFSALTAITESQCTFLHTVCMIIMNIGITVAVSSGVSIVIIIFIALLNGTI